MYVVTGGAGFIGSAVVWKLNQNGIDDILVVDNLGHSDKWKNLVNRTYRDYIHKSEFLEKITKGAFTGIKAIIHLGACSSTTERDADYLMTNNLQFSKKLAAHALEKDIRFINASSAATYGDGQQGFSDALTGISALKPLNMYGYSKQRFDIWAHRTQALQKLASLKFFNVFGPNEYHKADMCSVIFKAFHQVRETGKIRLFKSYHPNYPDGGQMRDFVYVKDCVDLIQWLVENPTVNGLFNVGTGCAQTWNALAEAVFEAMGASPQIEYIDMPEAIRDRYQYFTEADMTKIRNSGFTRTFTPLKAAVKDYIQTYLQQADPYL